MDELLAFINNEETTRPDGKKGAGLFRYLRSLTSSNGDDRRDVIATVFKGVDNRMKSGYLLRDVVNKVAGIRFTASDELHTLGALYEAMLREMRDAAGDSGEFYTPRPVVRFMVTVTDPRLGETVLDPASGTGGFLHSDLDDVDPDVLRRLIERTPHDYVAEARVPFATAPSWSGAAGARPKPILLRVFVAATKDGYKVMPGGLALSTSGGSPGQDVRGAGACHEDSRL